MPSAKVKVTFEGKKGYDIRIGPKNIDSLGAYLRSINESEHVFIVTDDTVAGLYLDRTKQSLINEKYDVHHISIGQGESGKTIDAAMRAWEAMAGRSFPRDGLVVALGGGVVGDIAGFVASTYMRGVDYVQVPTTLLAMVDSSVGGKTGVNLAQGKNLVGTFKQPLYVGASTDTLITLPEREWACGCAEIVKSALINSEDFFFWLDDHAGSLADREEDTVIEAITRSVVFKADVVAMDETESKGVRECLNYGHTLGHAVESLSGYGTFSHGQAVAEGMRFAAQMAQEVVGLSPDIAEAQNALLDTLGLFPLEWYASPHDMLSAMMKDKKVRSGQLRFVLPRDIGQWEIVPLEAEVVLAHLKTWEESKK